MKYNIYCDESCHLENDKQPIMVLGAVWCPTDIVKEIFLRIREIKVKHKLKSNFEIKWTKVSPAKKQFYLDLLDYFFNNDDLHFRALIVSNKDKLNHSLFNQDHDTWYYKMYFDMLKAILNQQDRFKIFLDIKDTKSSLKVKKLKEILSNELYDFKREIIESIQIVRSHEVELVQIADLLIGIISYVNRNLDKKANNSPAKVALVYEMKKRSEYCLTQTTLLRESKVNIFKWKPI